MTPPTRDYDAHPVSVQLGLEAVIMGPSSDLAELRSGSISTNDALAYGATAPIPLLADIPDWLAEAAYDELDRREFG